MSLPDEVAKFLDGDVIVDRRNPFKENDGSDSESITAYCESVLREKITKNVNENIVKNGDCHSPTNSNVSSSSGTIALPVKHNITGNILNIDETKEFPIHEQSLEDQEIIQKFLKEKDSDSDAYACLIRILTMDKESNKKKSFRDIIPSFFSKNSKNSKSKGEYTKVDSDSIDSPQKSYSSMEIHIPYNKFEENGDISLKSSTTLSNVDSSSCSTLVSESARKNSSSDIEIVNSTWTYTKTDENNVLNNELFISESSVAFNDSLNVAVPQESVKPKPKITKPPRNRSLSPYANNSNLERVSVAEPQYAYLKPKSPTPSNNTQVIVTKPTIHQQASPDNKYVENSKHVPMKEAKSIDNDIEFADESIQYRRDIVTSSPINNNRLSTGTYESLDRRSINKLSREQKEQNIKNVEAFCWLQLNKTIKQQNENFFKKGVLSTSDLHNRANNNSDQVQPWRCRSVSPNFSRNFTPVLSPTRKRINSNIEQPNNRFVRNSTGRNTIDSTSNINYYYKMKNDIYNNNLANESPAVYAMNSLGLPTTQSKNYNPVYGEIQKQTKININGVKPPIFKKGSLHAEPVPETPTKDKRVSFNQIYSTPKLESVHENLTVSNGSIYQPRPQTNDVYGKIQRKNVRSLYATVNTKHRSSYENYEIYAKANNKLNSSATNTAKNLFAQRVLTSKNALSNESESGSEGGEVQRIMQNALTMKDLNKYEDWNPDGKNRSEGSSQGEGGRGRVTRRDDPRRHTLGGDLLRSAPPHSALVRGMDIEHGLPKGYPPPSAMLFDDDPGIMSEVETASTGFRRGGKQRSSLPVVRTPSKTLERPLGLVFLQYRSETKRALLPNEITSIDTVKALFVRSFPKQLTMEYLDSPLVKIYIHDSSKDMFYELEDLRSHLRDIRDRSVLRLFESADVSGGTFPGSLGTGAGLPPLPSGPPSWDQDQSYFSEPEFDSDYHHQHIHKSKTNSKAPAYYMGTSGPSTLPRGGSLIRAYSPANAPMSGKPMSASTGAPPKPLRAYGSTASVVTSISERAFPFTTVDGVRIPDQLYSLPADRIHNDGYMSSPERGSRGAYEEPYYTQYVGPRGGMTPVIDEETGDSTLLDDQYSLYSVKIPPGPRTAMRPPPYDPNRLNAHSEDFQQRMRVDNMERQLMNLTGLVQKALIAPVVTPATRSDFLPPTPHFRTTSQESVDPFLRNERPPKLGKGRYHKSVSFEKSVSFSDEPPDMNSPKQHSPQHAADTKPPKPAIKSSTLPRMSSQERDRLKPVPPPKPKALVGAPGLIMPPGQLMTFQSVEYQNYLKGLLKKCKELRMDMRNLRRLTLAQAHTMREMICDTFVKFRTATSGSGEFIFHEDSMRLARDEEIYKQEMLKLEADLCDLENTVEQLRGSVINRKVRVNMVDVERMALVLSKSSKTVADLKVRFLSLHDGIKGILGNEMEKVVREEKFLKDEPDRLEKALRRCKKLTGTLVTLKRLASVQEQRSPCDGGRVSPGLAMDDNIHENAVHSKVRPLGESGGMALSIGGGDTAQRSENALDALLDELQTFAKPPDNGPDGDIETEGEGDADIERTMMKRLRGTTSPEISPAVIPRGQNVGKPPVPERNPELLQLAGRRAPPPPPPRTSSRSPLASPAATHPQLSASNSSSCDSVDSQEGARARQDMLEQRHQELLRKQKALQEQFARLQHIQRGGNSLAVVPPQDLKKTGSESNLVTKLGLNMAPAAPISGSLTHLARPQQAQPTDQQASTQTPAVPSTTSKVYETDIL